jgi:hypothetical protein
MCYSDDKIKGNEMGGACGARCTEEKCIYVLVGKPEGRRPTGRHKHRWEGDIKMDLKK